MSFVGAGGFEMLQHIAETVPLAKEHVECWLLVAHMVLGSHDYLKGLTVVLFDRDSLCEYVLLG